jgi:integrase/recombinase XerD
VSAAFHGPLAAQFEEFMALMRSTGGHYRSLAWIVIQLDRFLARSYPTTTALTTDVVRAWFASFVHVRPTTQVRYRNSTLQLCGFLHGRDPATATRDKFERIRVPRTFRPHIFSRDEMLQLLAAARALLPLKYSDPLRPWSMELVVTLLYTAGLRIGEVARLRVRDYDAKSACLIIRETKFGKSRLVPLSASARRIVDSYLRRRRDLGLTCGPLDSLRCCPGGHRATSPALQMSLDRLMRGCGLKPARGPGPRNHDLRHTFAVHRVLDWYRHGKNVQALLPHLVTYMGHRDLASTQQYLFLTSDVLHEASALFECFATASCARVQS